MDKDTQDYTTFGDQCDKDATIQIIAGIIAMGKRIFPYVKNGMILKLFINGQFRMDIMKN